MVLKFVGVILVICGIMWVYDARRIIRKFFNGMGDQNEGALGLKIFGMIFVLVGAFIVYFG